MVLESHGKATEMTQIYRYGPLTEREIASDARPLENYTPHYSAQKQQLRDESTHESDTLLPLSEVTESVSPSSEKTNPASADDRDIDKQISSGTLTVSDDEFVQQYSPRYHVFRWWTWEILALLIVIGIMIAIIVLFASFNNIEYTNWRSSMTPNSLAALLATILRTLMIFIIASVLSHWKWGWMSNQLRTLDDFRILDLGSRGLSGAVLVLSRFLLHHPVPSAAALVIVCSLSVATCVQQSIAIVNRARPGLQSSEVRLPYAHYVPGADADEYPVSFLVDLKYAISAALNEDKAPELALNLSCPTGNCTFPDGDPFEDNEPAAVDQSSTYSTVGICHRCRDISDLVKTNTSNITDFGSAYDQSSGWAYTVADTLPNGQNIKAVRHDYYFGKAGVGGEDLLEEKLNASAASGPWWDEYDMDGSTRAALWWSLANLTILTRTSTRCGGDTSQDCQHVLGSPEATRPLALTCYLYPCMQVYARPSIESTRLKESLLSSVPLELSQVVVQRGNNSSPIDDLGPPNLQSEYFGSYKYDFLTAVKSPCKVAGSVYTLQNMTLASNLSRVWMFKTNHTSVMTRETFTAPAECLYQMNLAFWHALRTRYFQIPSLPLSDAYHLFNASIFNGICQDKPSSACVGGSLPWPGLMNEKWLSNLAHNGASSFETIDNVVRSFADSMTTSFRVTLGSKLPPGYNPWSSGRGTVDGRLPADYIQGSTVFINPVIEITWEWLLLPILLTIITTILLTWSISESWRHRGSMPVWKDDILIPMMYRHHFVLSDDSALSLRTLKESKPGAPADDNDERLAEPDYLATLAKRCQVRFRLNEKETTSALHADVRA